MRSRYFCLICLICICCFCKLLAFDTVSHGAPNKVVGRTFDQSKINSYAKNSDFLYTQTPESSEFWTQCVEWIAEKLSKFFNNVYRAKISTIVVYAIKTVLWGLGLFAIIMIFLSLFRNGLFTVIAKTDKEIKLDFQQLEENVLINDWQSLIASEISNERYNVAIRLLFLQTLQQLSNKKYIVWDKNKTNNDYKRELRNTNLESAFSLLVQYYNYGWFGDFEINANTFNVMQSAFIAFNTRGI